MLEKFKKNNNNQPAKRRANSPDDLHTRSTSVMRQRKGTTSTRMISGSNRQTK